MQQGGLKPTKIHIEDSKFNHNHADMGYGGAIEGIDGLEIDLAGGNIFLQNSASQGGGAVFVRNITQLEVSGAEFYGNHVKDGQGGAIWAWVSTDRCLSSVCILELF